MILPLGHLTGLRNSMAVLTLVATLATTGFHPWKELPARKALLLLVAWATISAAWSADPGLTWSKLRTDLYIPVWAYCASFTWARNSRDTRCIFAGLATGMILLAAISAFTLLPVSGLDRIISEAQFSGLHRAVPSWYPGVGDASTYTVLCVAGFLFWTAWTRRWRTLTSVVVAAATLVALAISQNRNAAVVLPLAIAVFFGVWGWGRSVAIESPRQASKSAPAFTLTVVSLGLCCLIIASLFIEAASRERLATMGEPVPAWGAAALTMASHDPRPRMWQEYLHLGLAHPWTGVGFGRTVPGVAYHTRADPILTAADPNAFSHAHNIFINLWLQLGLVGVILYLAVFVGIVRTGMRYAVTSRAAALGYAGIVTLILAALLRDLTDDFLIFAMATVFWSCLGTLLAAQRVPDATPSPSSDHDPNRMTTRL